MAIQGADDAARERARDVYAAWTVDAASVDAELAAAATGVIAALGDADTYDRFVEISRTGTTPQVQLRHLMLLAEFDNAELMRRTCEHAFSGEVKTQSAPFLMRLCVGNPNHGEQAWEFLRQHWAEANEMFPRNTIVRMAEQLVLHDRPAQVAQAAAFFAEHPIEQAAQTLEQILERQRVNARVRADNADALASSLTDRA